MAAPRRGTFAFDLSKPIKRGALLKQGAYHRAFKHREFILYPGFLVYYETETKWRLDLTKGETLGGRQGAVKLKGATVGIARNAPKACKFGLMLSAPDPANKRQTYLMNASSKEERDDWIESIRKATPSSPHMNRKDLPPSAGKSEETPTPTKTSGSTSKVEPPPPALRQNTACDAAVMAASLTDKQEEQKEIDEVITSVNSSLVLEPNMLTRLNTATQAALSLGSMDKPPENGVDVSREEPETSIDLILGKQEDISRDGEDDSSSCLSSTPEPVTPDLVSPDPITPNTMSPDPEDAMEMETNQTVKNEGDGDNGETTVTTTVTVECSNNSQESPGSSPALVRQEAEEEEEGEGEGKGEGEGEKPTTVLVNGEEEEIGEDDTEENDANRMRSTSSTQILVSDHENVTLSVNLNGYDSDNTLSDEESHSELPELLKDNADESSPPVATPTIAIKEERTGSTDTTNDKEDSNGRDESASKEGQVESNGKEERSGQKSNGESLSNGHTETNGKAESNGKDETTTLTPPTNQRRRTSTPFVEKKGYLYKMGGQRKTWKLRYFVLRPGVFNYFKDGTNHKPIGEVKLKNLSVFFPGIGERKQSFQFTVHTESSWNKRADWVFAGQSEREMKEWITAFKLAGMKPGSASPEPEI